MSTKSSFFLTGKNEHWYYEGLDDSIVIEIDNDSMLEMNYDSKDGLYIALKKESELYKELIKRLGG